MEGALASRASDLSQVNDQVYQRNLIGLKNQRTSRGLEQVRAIFMESPGPSDYPREFVPISQPLPWGQQSTLVSHPIEIGLYVLV